MSQLVMAGATMQCSFGTAPATFNVLPTNLVVGGAPYATIMDHIPFINILPCGMCTSLANPLVASATAAALGALTPQPCLPATSAPWLQAGQTVLIGNQPALSSSAKCMCLYGGVITINLPGQMTVQVP